MRGEKVRTRHRRESGWAECLDPRSRVLACWDCDSLWARHWETPREEGLSCRVAAVGWEAFPSHRASVNAVRPFYNRTNMFNKLVKRNPRCHEKSVTAEALTMTMGVGRHGDADGLPPLMPTPRGRPPVSTFCGGCDFVLF